jgi:DNA-binding CsgD family transcriptional regulator
MQESLPNIFIDYNLEFSRTPDYNWFKIRESNIISEAVCLNLCHLLIDHYKQSMSFCSYNTEISEILGLNGNCIVYPHFITDKIPPVYQNEFFEKIKIINKSIRNNILNDDKYYYFTFTTYFSALNSTKKIIFKAIPYQFTEFTSYGTPWLTYYLISTCCDDIPEHLVLHTVKYDQKLHFILRQTKKPDDFYAILTDKDIEIISYSVEGYKENEIAHVMKLSISALRTKKYLLLSKLKCKSMTQVISVLIDNGLLQKYEKAVI